VHAAYEPSWFLVASSLLTDAEDGADSAHDVRVVFRELPAHSERIGRAYGLRAIRARSGYAENACAKSSIERVCSDACPASASLRSWYVRKEHLVERLILLRGELLLHPSLEKDVLELVLRPGRLGECRVRQALPAVRR